MKSDQHRNADEPSAESLGLLTLNTRRTSPPPPGRPGLIQGVRSDLNRAPPSAACGVSKPRRSPGLGLLRTKLRGAPEQAGQWVPSPFQDRGAEIHQRNPSRRQAHGPTTSLASGPHSGVTLDGPKTSGKSLGLPALISSTKPKRSLGSVHHRTHAGVPTCAPAPPRVHLAETKLVRTTVLSNGHRAVRSGGQGLGQPSRQSPDGRPPQGSAVVTRELGFFPVPEDEGMSPPTRRPHETSRGDQGYVLRRSLLPRVLCHPS